MTAEEALNYIRLVGAEIDNVYYVYVIRADETPLGVVTLKKLLLSPPKTPVAAIMVTRMAATAPEERIDIADIPPEMLAEGERPPVLPEDAAELRDMRSCVFSATGTRTSRHSP